MKVAVWDTYAKAKDGRVLHFDIIVPEYLTNASTIFQYGKEYLASLGEAESEIHSKNCQFCHIEEPSEDVKKAIQQKGYYIYRMEDIPAQLFANPSRREMILYLKGHFDEYRFADFRGKTEEEVKKILQSVKSN